MTAGTWMIGAGFCFLGAVLFAYPLLLSVFVPFKRRQNVRPSLTPSDEKPTITAIVAFRGWNDLARLKIENFASLEYPAEKLQVIFVSDGPLSGPVAEAEIIASHGWLLLEDEAAAGKNSALNVAVERADGDLLLFTDIDAQLAPDTLNLLAAQFQDEAVGGVCGLRVQGENRDALQDAQASYISWDSWIKEQESRLGYLTSNDGKLYMIRRSLFTPVADAVTDDLFQGLNILRQHRKMLFVANARAFIPKPSRSLDHEVSRRRRIVTRSLHGIYLNRTVLNPLRYGLLSVGLVVNKIMRRLIPLFFGLIVLGAVVDFGSGLHTHAILAGSAVICAAALLGASNAVRLLPKPVNRFMVLSAFIVIGFIGTVIGVCDFLRGRRVARWDPVKSDSPAT